MREEPQRKEGGSIVRGEQYFLCRHCYDLRFESQRDNKTNSAKHTER
jgi:hypothetical protein